MKTKPPAPSQINERRDFFRIEDQVQMRYACVDESSALANIVPPEFRHDVGYSLIRELQRIDREHSVQLRNIVEDNRDLEIYLKAINKKIELIAARIAEDSDNRNHKEHQLISISEGGMSFRIRKELANDCYLALQLTLQPSHITLVLFSRVINCSMINSDKTNGFAVAVSFVNLKEEDRQTIAKHIMQLQLAQRRQQHEE